MQSSNYTVNLTVNTNNAGALLARVVKYLDTTWQNYQVLAQTNVQGSGKYTLSFTAPSGGNTYLWVGTQAGMTTGMSYSITTAVVTGYTSGITVMLADETQSAVPDYRYGNDGQERDDEVAGPGNHYTAEFWQYDPRLIIRATPDPRPVIGVSPYSAFGDNPISNVDPFGDTVSFGDNNARDKFYSAKNEVDRNVNVYNKRIQRAEAKGNYNRVVKLKAKAESWDKMQADFDAVIDAKTDFHYSTKPEGSNTSGTYYDFANQRVNLDILVGLGEMSHYIHETHHGADFLRGKWTQATNDGGKNVISVGYDYTDESSAYELEYNFDPITFNKIHGGASISTWIKNNYPSLLNKQTAEDVTHEMIDNLIHRGYKVATPNK